MKFFKKHGAKDGNEDNQKLFDACCYGDLKNLKKLLADSPEGAINTLCTEEWKNYLARGPIYAKKSLLWLACAKGHLEIVEWLLLNGAKTNDESIEELLAINCNHCTNYIKHTNNKDKIEQLLNLEKIRNKEKNKI